jgi:hypothetical protein
MNFKIFSKKYFVLERKILEKKINYRELKLRKKIYGKWEKVDYTLSISYKI